MYPSKYPNRRRRAATLLVMILYGSACQAWHTERVTPESLLVTRQPATFRVTRTDGSQIVLEHPVLRADTLSGTVRGPNEQQDVRIPLTEVREVATRGFSAGRTVGLVVGVAAGTFAVIVVAVVIACSQTGCFE
jgi:hypothetical protein